MKTDLLQMTNPNRLFRKALGCFATGITVVTSRDESGKAIGLTVSSFSSLSFDPPLVLVCLDKRTVCLEAIKTAGYFAVHVLRLEQRELSITFAGKLTDKFAHIAWETRVTGAPVIPGCLALFDCRTEQVIEGGDHLILLGRVAHVEYSEAGQPLLYYRCAYGQMGDTNLP